MNNDKNKTNMMKSGTNLLTSLVLIILSPVMMVAQAPDTIKTTKHEFSVKEAIDYGMKNNVNVKNALLNVKNQQQVNDEVTAIAYPQINATVSTTLNPNVATQVLPNFISPATYQVLIDQGVKDGNGIPIQMPADFGFIAAQFGTKYSAQAGISLSQILFDGQVFIGLKARKATLEFASKNYDITAEMIKTNIYKVYYQLVLSKTQLALLDANLDLLQKNLKDTRIIYENGFREKLDVDKASVQLANLETEKRKVLNTISNGYYGLKVLIGMPVHDQLILTDSLSEEQIKEDILDKTNYTYNDRKDFQYALIGKQLNEFNIKRYQLSKIPTLTLNGNYAKNAQREKWNFLGKGEWYTLSNVSLNMNIPIFNGFYTRSKLGQAKIQLETVNNQIEALKLSIDNDVAVSTNNFKSAIADIDFQKRNMTLAETVYNQTKKKYEAGTGSQVDIDLAQTNLKEAQTNYITALYDAVIAKIDFLKATGKLD